MPSIAVIIVNWNTKDLLAQCIRSVLETTGESISPQIIVVDNASTDGSVEMLEKEFPMISALEMDSNMGFAKANNVAIGRVLKSSKPPDYLLFLNSDIILSEKAINHIVDALEVNDKIAVAGPALILKDGSYQTGSAGFRVSPYSGFIYFSLLFKILPLPFAKGLYIDQKRYHNCDGPVMVGWLSGACFLVRSSVIREVGGWDESFFMYAEDVELSDRITDAGWKIAYLPQVRVLHHHGASSTHMEIPNTKWLITLFQFIRSKRGNTEYLIFRSFAVAGAVIRLCVYFSLYIFTFDKKWRKKTRELQFYFKAALTGKEPS